MKAEQGGGRRLTRMRKGQKKILLMIAEDPATLNHYSGLFSLNA
jgi:hypothetical protein